MAMKQTDIKECAGLGGVAANSGLRKRLPEIQKNGFKTFYPKLQHSTDNAAMIAIAGYYNFVKATLLDRK